MVGTPKFAQRIEQFRGCLGGRENELRLCAEYVTEWLRVHGAKAIRDDPSLRVFVALTVTGVGGGREYVDWVLARIDESLSTSLFMVAELHHHVTENWVFGGGDVVRAHIRDGMLRRADDGGYLGRVLDPEYPYTLNHIVRLPPADGVPNPTEDWLPFVPHLLAGAEAAPAVVVPHMVYVFTDDRRNHPDAPVVEGSPFFFDSKYASALIVDQESRVRLVRIFRDYCGMQGARAEIATRIQVVMPALLAFAEGHSDTFARMLQVATALRVGTPPDPGESSAGDAPEAHTSEQTADK
jgi:hypothetical protein